MNYIFNIPKTKFSKILKRIVRVEYEIIDFCGGYVVKTDEFEIPLDRESIELSLDDRYIPWRKNTVMDAGNIFSVTLTDYKTENKFSKIELIPQIKLED